MLRHLFCLKMFKGNGGRQQCHNRSDSFLKKNLLWKEKIISFQSRSLSRRSLVAKTKQDVTKVISLVKMVDQLPGTS